MTDRKGRSSAQGNLQGVKDQFQRLAPAGFYIALRVGFSFPEEELNALPARWVDFYTRHGLVVQDPGMVWVYANSGAIRLSCLPVPDRQQIYAHAAVFGLVFGAIVSICRESDRGRRSYGFFYREDREFQDQELHALSQAVTALHDRHHAAPALTEAEVNALRLQAQGLRLKQIADQLSISESAVKARLNNAKRKLGARTLSQAASIASSRRVLE